MIASYAAMQAERERDPEGQAGGRVAEVVDGVGQEGDRAGDDDDDRLQERGDPEADQRPLQRPDAELVRFHRGVDRVLDAVGVREGAAHPAEHTGAVALPARPMLVAVFAVFMPMFGEGCRACAFVAMLMFVLALVLARRLIVVIVVTRHRRPLSLWKPSGDAPGRRRPRDAFTMPSLSHRRCQRRCRIHRALQGV